MCNNLSWKSSLKDGAQLHGAEPRNIDGHTLPQLFVSQQLLRSLLVLSLPDLPWSPDHLPAPAIFRDGERGGPLQLKSWQPLRDGPPHTPLLQIPPSILSSYGQAQLTYLRMVHEGKVQHTNRHQPRNNKSTNQCFVCWSKCDLSGNSSSCERRVGSRLRLIKGCATYSV